MWGGQDGPLPVVLLWSQDITGQQDQGGPAPWICVNFYSQENTGRPRTTGPGPLLWICVNFWSQGITYPAAVVAHMFMPQVT